MREPIEVRVLEDRIEIVSHPGADRSITLDGLKKYQVFNRRYRNRRIGEFLKEMGLTEGRNTGFRKILNSLKENGSPKPIFYTDPERLSFATTIFIHPDFWIFSGLNMKKEFKRDCEIILNMLKNNPESTYNEIMDELSVSRKTVSTRIKFLKINGNITREGSPKSGKWIVNSMELD